MWKCDYFSFYYYLWQHDGYCLDFYLSCRNS